jgi:hypothetical protein
MKRGMTYPTVIVLDLLLAGTAILGGVFIVPTLPQEWLAGSPFSSYLVPAMALTLIGVIGSIGAIELSFERPLGIVASLAGGLAITAFEVVQIVVLTLGDWLQPLGIAAGHHLNANSAGLHPGMYLEPVYIALGLAIVIWTLRLYRQEVAEIERAIEAALEQRKPARP